LKIRVPETELCRRERASSNVYHSWLKDLMEADKEPKILNVAVKSESENRLENCICSSFLQGVKPASFY